MNFKTGDWVRSYSAGIWRVEREFPTHFEPRYSLKGKKQLCDGSIFILKRIVNNKWKPAFDIEAVDGSLIRALNKADNKKPDAFLSANPEIVAQFEEFKKSLQSLLNLGFALERKSDLPKLKKEVTAKLGDLSAGVTSDEIIKAIAATSFAETFGDIPKSATLQFVNVDFEIRRRNLIYREMNTLKF